MRKLILGMLAALALLGVVDLTVPAARADHSQEYRLEQDDSCDVSYRVDYYCHGYWITDSYHASYRCACRRADYLKRSYGHRTRIVVCYRS